MEKIYIDSPRYWGRKKTQRWCHMICQDLKVLHAFAESNGIPRHRFENKKGKQRPHYDVREDEFNSMLESGAILITSAELVTTLKQWQK